MKINIDYKKGSLNQFNKSVAEYSFEHYNQLAVKRSIIALPQYTCDSSNLKEETTVKCMDNNQHEGKIYDSNNISWKRINVLNTIIICITTSILIIRTIATYHHSNQNKHLNNIPNESTSTRSIEGDYVDIKVYGQIIKLIVTKLQWMKWHQT